MVTDVVETSPCGRFLRFEGRLGGGAYKTVWKAYDTEEGTEVAWNVAQLEGVAKRERDRVVSEVSLLKELKHESIVRYVASWTSDDGRSAVFITEMVGGGSLKDFLNRVQGNMRYGVVKRWCTQVLSGIAFLHAHRPPIIHRDIKADNFFYDAASGTVCIGDFGLSALLTSGAKSTVGTPNYMAPEMWGDGPYDEKVDIYAFGLSVLEMITRTPPYEGLSFVQILKKVCDAGEAPRSVHRIRSGAARAFILQCLGAAASRPSAEELLRDPFLRADADFDEEECLVDALPEGADSDYDASRVTPAAGSPARRAPAHGTMPSSPVRLGEPLAAAGAEPREASSRAALRRSASEPPDAHAMRAGIQRRREGGGREARKADAVLALDDPSSGSLPSPAGIGPSPPLDPSARLERPAATRRRTHRRTKTDTPRLHLRRSHSMWNFALSFGAGAGGAHGEGPGRGGGAADASRRDAAAQQLCIRLDADGDGGGLAIAGDILSLVEFTVGEGDTAEQLAAEMVSCISTEAGIAVTDATTANIADAIRQALAAAGADRDEDPPRARVEVIQGEGHAT